MALEGDTDPPLTWARRRSGERGLVRQGMTWTIPDRPCLGSVLSRWRLRRLLPRRGRHKFMPCHVQVRCMSTLGWIIVIVVLLILFGGIGFTFT